MKKKTFFCALIIMCVSIIAYGTSAYFTTEDTATNVITAGNIKIDLQEWAVPDDGGEPVPFEDATDVMPGTEVSKIVQVKNTGGQPAWIRISLKESIILAEGVTGDADLSLISYDLNKDNWTEKDGYYYYNKALEPDDTTEPLFTKVIFSEKMSNMYRLSKAVIEVNAEATQTANNGKTVFEAAGWSEVQ